MSRLHTVGRTAARTTTAAATAGVGAVEQACQQLQDLLHSSAATYSRHFGTHTRPGTTSSLRRVNIKPLGSAAAAAEEGSTASGAAYILHYILYYMPKMHCMAQV
jgi:HPt (histidine-containing phosphotransfer) domain-containing protein